MSLTRRIRRQLAQLFRPWRAGSDEAEDAVHAFGEHVAVAPLSDEVEALIIDLRKRYRLKTPDVIVAATALEIGARLVSADDVFSRVEGLDVVNPAR